MNWFDQPFEEISLSEGLAAYKESVLQLLATHEIDGESRAEVLRMLEVLDETSVQAEAELTAYFEGAAQQAVELQEALEARLNAPPPPDVQYPDEDLSPPDEGPALIPGLGQRLSVELLSEYGYLVAAEPADIRELKSMREWVNSSISLGVSTLTSAPPVAKRHEETPPVRQTSAVAAEVVKPASRPPLKSSTASVDFGWSTWLSKSRSSMLGDEDMSGPAQSREDHWRDLLR